MSETQSFRDMLLSDGVLRDPGARLIPLTGGVSSEIYLVEDGDDRFVIKRALAKLKVKDDWFADVGRNQTEHRFLECVASFLPDAVPRVRFADAAKGYFAMEYLGEGFQNWKQLLLAGTCNLASAQQAGDILGRLQKATMDQPELVRAFDTTENFRQLRIDPYLITAAARNEAVSAILLQEAARLGATRECLVHGDFSPKNILIHPDRMVLVDCEVAWFGDAAFDPAFLLSHLLLKALFHAPRRLSLNEMALAFWEQFLTERVDANNVRSATFERRVVRLMLMLMLARVDGKSRVEYLDASKAQIVREFSTNHLLNETEEVGTAVSSWTDALGLSNEQHS